MKSWMLIPLGAGIALLGYGLLQNAPEPKALQPLGDAPADPNTLPKHDPNEIPKHTKHQDNSGATYCQLLTAYEEDLKRWLTMQTDAENRMNDALTKAGAGPVNGVCDDLAWDATWNYDYGFAGLSGWTTLHKSKSPSVKQQCLSYVKGLSNDRGSPHIQDPPKEGANFLDSSWLDVASAIRALLAQVREARVAVKALRDQYLKAKDDYQQATAKVAELQKKIADLEAQGVSC